MTFVVLFCEDANLARQIGSGLSAQTPLEIKTLTTRPALWQLLDPNDRQTGTADGKIPPSLLILHLDETPLPFLERLFSLKKTSSTQHIPVIVWSNKLSTTEISAVYRLGAAAVILQNAHTNSLAKTLADVGEYWFRSVILPTPRARGQA